MTLGYKSLIEICIATENVYQHSDISELMIRTQSNIRCSVLATQGRLDFHYTHFHRQYQLNVIEKIDNFKTNPKMSQQIYNSTYDQYLWEHLNMVTAFLSQ